MTNQYTASLLLILIPGLSVNHSVNRPSCVYYQPSSFDFSDRDILKEDEAGMDLINSYVGRHPFSTVAGDNDQGRRARLHGRSPEEIDVLELQRKYASFPYLE